MLRKKRVLLFVWPAFVIFAHRKRSGASRERACVSQHVLVLGRTETTPGASVCCVLVDAAHCRRQPRLPGLGYTGVCSVVVGGWLLVAIDVWCLVCVAWVFSFQRDGGTLGRA